MTLTPSEFAADMGVAAYPDLAEIIEWRPVGGPSVPNVPAHVDGITVSADGQLLRSTVMVTLRESDVTVVRTNDRAVIRGRIAVVRDVPGTPPLDGQWVFSMDLGVPE